MFALLTLEFRSYVQPLLILLIIPFGAVGAVAGHVLLRLPVTLFSLFGLVALTGVVVHGTPIDVATAGGMVMIVVGFVALSLTEVAADGGHAVSIRPKKTKKKQKQHYAKLTEPDQLGTSESDDDIADNDPPPRLAAPPKAERTPILAESA